jgi:hypothetical protein
LLLDEHLVVKILISQLPAFFTQKNEAFFSFMLPDHDSQRQNPLLLGLDFNHSIFTSLISTGVSQMSRLL